MSEPPLPPPLPGGQNVTVIVQNRRSGCFWVAVIGAGILVALFFVLVVVPAACVGAAVAIPTIEKVRETAQQKAAATEARIAAHEVELARVAAEDKAKAGWPEALANPNRWPKTVKSTQEWTAPDGTVVPLGAVLSLSVAQDGGLLAVRWEGKRLQVPHEKTDFVATLLPKP